MSQTDMQTAPRTERAARAALDRLSEAPGAAPRLDQLTLIERLLVLLYLEARGGTLPTQSEAWVLGLSPRSLSLWAARSEPSSAPTGFFTESLAALFRLTRSGRRGEALESEPLRGPLFERVIVAVPEVTLAAVLSSLSDPAIAAELARLDERQFGALADSIARYARQTSDERIPILAHPLVRAGLLDSSWDDSAEEREFDDAFVPQADSLERLCSIIEAAHRGASDRSALAETVGVSERAAGYYVALADWLEWAREENGTFLLSELGHKCAAHPEQRRDLFRFSLLKKDLARHALQRWVDEAGLDLAAACLDVLTQRTSLAESTARRRASALTSLLREATTAPGARRLEVRLTSIESSEADPPDPHAPPPRSRAPIGEVEMPRLLRLALAKLGAHTLHDALEIDPERAARVRGIGRKRIKQLVALQRAHSTSLPTDSDPAPSLAARIHEAGVPLEAPWREVLVHAPTRLHTTLRRMSVQSLGELIALFERGKMTEIRKLGRASVRALGDQLELIADTGLDAYFYGPRGRPREVSALVERALENLSERDRAILVARLEGEDTLQTIGDRVGLTRERIRQIESRVLDDARRTWGAVAGELLADEIAALRESGGLIASSELSESARACDPGALGFALALAGVHGARPWAERLWTSWTKTRADELLSRLKAKLEASERASVSLAELTKALGELGVSTSAQSARALAHLGYGAKWDGDSFASPWFSIRDQFLVALKRAGKPLDLEGARAARASIFDRTESDDLESHQLRAFLQRAPKIYSYGHGLYVHLDNLPVPPEWLNEAATWAAQKMRDLEGRTNAEELLRDLESDRRPYPGLTPHLLKDALVRVEPDVLTFRNTLHLAWGPTYQEHGLDRHHYIQAVLLEADGPLSPSDIMEALADRGVVYADTTVYQTIIQEPYAVPLGRGEYAHRSSFGLDESAIEELLDTTWSALPDDGEVLSASALLASIDGAKAARALIKRDDASAALWGLARVDERFETHAGELVARRVEEREGAHLLDAALATLWEQAPLWSPASAYEELTSRGFVGSRASVAHALYRARDAGRLVRLPRGVYARLEPTEERTCAAWRGHEEIIAGAIGHAEILECDARALALLERFARQEMGREDLAARVKEARGDEDAPEFFEPEGLGDAASATLEPADPPELAALLEYAEPEEELVIRAAHLAGAPAPKLGFTIRGASGRVALEVSIAWPEARLGIAYEPDPRSIALGERAGWNILPLRTKPEVILERLCEATQ